MPQPQMVVRGMVRPWSSTEAFARAHLRKNGSEHWQAIALGSRL